MIQRVHENQKLFVLLSYIAIYQRWKENFGTLQVWREQYVQLIGGKNKTSKPTVFCQEQCELEKRVCVRPTWNLLTFYTCSVLIWSEIGRIL